MYFAKSMTEARRPSLPISSGPLPNRCFTFSFCILLLFADPSFVFAEDYFQQQAHYTLRVKLDDKQHVLHADEELVYINNSQDTLHELYIHLWPNAYSGENTSLAKEFYKNGESSITEADSKDLGYIDSLDFRVNGESVSWKLLTDTPDIGKIRLNKPLNPGDSLLLTTPFRVKLPNASISRLGHTGQAYFITQWFPKPAVYDKNGWNYFSYLDKGEYYGEFGTFDVFITLPSNYVLAATGERIDASSEIEWLTAKAKETQSTDEFSQDLSFPPSSTEEKTVHFRQENVHDFAWFADKRWHVYKGEVELRPSGKKVTTWAMFTGLQAGLWKKAPDHLRDAILYFSNWVGEYPYSEVTAVDVGYASGGGMEYPMITAIDRSKDEFDFELVIEHEVGHNWFYGILGSNERRHPWMDEGINQFYETRYVYTKYAADSSLQKEWFTRMGSISRYLRINRENHRELEYWSYLTGARRNADLSPGLSAEKYDYAAYHEDVYRKTALVFDYLLNYLGDSLFDACMRTYYESWKFRHPQPEDVRHVFETVSGKNLSWLFNDLLNGSDKIDYSLSYLSKKGTNYTLTIKNKARIQSPVSISGMRDRKILQTTWLEGFQGKKSIELNCDSCTSFRIDPTGRIPELYRNNNTIRTSGFLKKTERLRFRFPAAMEDPMYSQVFYSPVAGWNKYNGIMAGVAVYNVLSPEKKFEYTLVPMYAFGTQDLAGGGDLRFHLYPRNSAIEKITLRAGLSRYAYLDDVYDNEFKQIHYRSTLHFLKVDNRIEFVFRNPDRKEMVTRQFSLRHIYLEREMPYRLYYEPKKAKLNYFQGDVQFMNTNPFYKNSQHLTLTAGKDLYKASIETRNFLNYGKPGKGFHIRLFAGLLHLAKTITRGIDYNMRLSGVSGADDYLFDEVFPGRTETKGLWSQQFVADDAGFKVPTLFYRKGNEWMVGVNASTTLPGILPFKLFADIGSFNDAQKGYPEARAISWDWGIELPVIKDIFVVYFPVGYSKDIAYVVDQQELHYGNLIRFELHLRKLNPLDLFRSISF